MRQTFLAGVLLFALYRWQSSVPTTGWVQGQGYSTTGIPAGLVTMIVSSSCPTGFSEVTALNGKFLQGTLAANGDVGTTGGNSTITPGGQVSTPTLTMNPYTPTGTNSSTSFTPIGILAWPVSVPTFTGSALATHQHELPFQDPGATGATNFRGINPATFGTGTSRAGAWGITTSSSTTSAAVALSQAVSAGTPAGTIAWPAAVPSFVGSGSTVPAQNFTGTPATLSGNVSQPTFTGSAIDPRPLFTKVIFCSKN